VTPRVNVAAERLRRSNRSRFALAQRSSTGRRAACERRYTTFCPAPCRAHSFGPDGLGRSTRAYRSTRPPGHRSGFAIVRAGEKPRHGTPRRDTSSRWARRRSGNRARHWGRRRRRPASGFRPRLPLCQAWRLPRRPRSLARNLARRARDPGRCWCHRCCSRPVFPIAYKRRNKLRRRG